MKKVNTRKTQRARSKATRTVLLLFSVLLLVTGIILLLIDPIKRMNRNRITDEALQEMQRRIEQTIGASEMTYIVPATGNEVEGEAYDFVGETEETTTEEEGDGSGGSGGDSGDYVLTSIGILEISSIGRKFTVWDEASQVSLRYGVGHYVDSVMPGEVGNATILGHNYRDGSMFHYLGNLQVGDSVVFTNNNGEQMVFYVTDSLIISADEIMNYALGNITDARQLTLITCTYEYGRTGWRRVVICQMPEDAAAVTESTDVITDTESTEEAVTEATEPETEAPAEPTEAETEAPAEAAAEAPADTPEDTVAENPT